MCLPPLPHQLPQRRRVEPAQRGAQQPDRLTGLQFASGRDLQRQQQRPDGLSLRQRDLVPGQLDRHPGPGAGARNLGQPASAAGQHRHLAVVDAPLDPRPPQLRGDPARLRRLAGVMHDPDRPRPISWPRIADQPRRHRQPALQPLDRRRQLTAEPMPLSEQLHPRRPPAHLGEDARELRRDPRMGAPEGVHRRLRVGRGQDAPAVGHELPQQPDLGRVEVGHIVHQHGIEPLSQVVQHRRRPQQQPRSVNEFGVVKGLFGVQHVEVLGEELACRLPGRQLRLRPQRSHILRVEPQLAGPRQHRPHLTGETGRPQRRTQHLGPPLALLTGQQLPHPELLLRSGQQPPVAAFPVLIQQRPRQRMDGGHVQLGDPARVRRDPVPKRARRSPPRRQHQRRPSSAQLGDGGRRDSRRLPRPRAANQQQRTVPVQHADHRTTCH